MGKTVPALDIHVPACDPQLQELVLAELDDFEPTAIHEPDGSPRLRVFFTTSESRAAAARALAVSFGIHLVVETLDVHDDDWAARSQAQLRAVTVGRLVIAPPWDRGADAMASTVMESAPLLIIIQPSMGFGTGHHSTTRLVLNALQGLALTDRTMLDLGCGSGVLAIAAIRLGALSATAIDTDPDALANAAENLALNNVQDSVRLDRADFRDHAPSADVVAANLTGALLARAASRLAALVNPNGALIVSGFMESERAPVISALDPLLTFERIEQEEEWLCAVYTKPPVGGAGPI